MTRGREESAWRIIYSEMVAHVRTLTRQEEAIEVWLAAESQLRFVSRR